MADAATTADAARTDTGARDDHSFLWRRLHSLSGVLPLGAFLCYHMFENLSALRGPAAYDEMVNHVNTLAPAAVLLRAGAGDHRRPAGLPRALRRLGRGHRASERRPVRLRRELGLPRPARHRGDRAAVPPGARGDAAHVGHPARQPPRAGDGRTASTWSPTATSPPTSATRPPWASRASSPATTSSPSTSSARSAPSGTSAYGLKGFCWTWGIAVGRLAQRRVTQVAWLLFAVLSVGDAEHPLPDALRRRRLTARDETPMAEQRFTVVGGGLAGLMAVIKLCEAGHKVDLLSIVPVKRSHSVCAQGGINGAVNTKGEGDHPDIHVKDTLRGGDFLAEQTSVSRACATRRRASSTCSTGWACRSTAPRKGSSTSGASAGRCTTAPRSPGPPPASSCSTRSTSRSAASRRTGW